MSLDWVSTVIGFGVGLLLGLVSMALWKSLRASRGTYHATIALMRTVTAMLERYDRRRDGEKQGRGRTPDEERS